MPSVELLFCEDFLDPFWNLPIPAGRGRRGLLAWRLDPPPVDGGVPVEVALLLSRGLCERFRVSFPAASHGKYRFVHTLRATEAAEAFDAEYFDWTQQSQLIFLSAPDANPPGLTTRSLDEARDPGRMGTLGFAGLVLPGVDGAVAGLYCFRDEDWAALTGGLKASSAAAGAGWRAIAVEAEFRLNVGLPPSLPTGSSGCQSDR